MRSLILAILTLLSLPASAESAVLRAIVSDSNAPPYAMFDQNAVLVGGVSKALLENLATRSGLTLQFLSLPRGRVEQWLLRNEADIACFLSPQWVEHPATLAWSPALFETRQVIVRRTNSPAVNQLSDLFGKRIGTERGFSYPEFDDLFQQRVIVRDDAISLHSNLSRLEKQRIDAVLTVDRAYHYHQQQFGRRELSADLLWIEPDKVYCAINPNNIELANQLQQYLEQIVADGTLEQILTRYQPAQPKL